MKAIVEVLYDKFRQATLKAYPGLSGEIPIEVVQSTQEKFGDYQFNSAMKLSKALKENPRKIAETIYQKVDPQPLITKMEIAGPGFINITLNNKYLSSCVQEMFEDKHLAIETPEVKQQVIVEFSSPNIAKELHVGHLRSTIIGDCIARLFEFLGHDVLRLNHVGDWGTQFGMLIAYIKEEAPKVLTGEAETDLNHLVDWYKKAKHRFDHDADFKKVSQLEVVALQEGDSAALKAWEIFCTITRKAYQEIYDLLDIKLTERGESFYNPILPEIISDLDQKGLIQESYGARCLFIEGFINRDGNPLPLMLQKSDGGYTYDTTDMAAMKHRVEQEKAGRIIIVTDIGQSQHFEMIYSASIKANYLDPKKVRFDHVTFGLVRGSDGKKFSTRSGETERLIDLLTTAITKAEKIMEERNPDMPMDERKQIAKALALGAVKYADLSSHRASDYIFSYDRMLRFEGNTAAFLMYAYVRVAGIKRKIGADLNEVKEHHIIKLEHPSEIALGLHLARFWETLNQVANDLLPNRLTDYLFSLAQKFNAFYRDCPVEGSPQEGSRLLLCETVARTMKQGLHLLGVGVVERM